MTPAPSLFAGPQDTLAPPPPPDPGPRCGCSPLAPSPGRGRLQARRQLSIACTVCCVFMVGEVIGNGGTGMGAGGGGCRGAQCQLLCARCSAPAGGYLAHSLAIMTDAAHLLMDVGSMSVSLFSLWVSTRPPTKTMTFGWHRSGEPGGNTAPQEHHSRGGC